MHEIYKPKRELADPHVSPDGKNVAFVEGLMSDAGLTGGEIMLVPLAGGPARNLTPGIKASPSAVTWSGSDRIVFAQNLDGNSSYATVGIDASTIQTLWTGEELTGSASGGWEPSGSFSRDASKIAVVRESGGTPPEVWAGPIGKWEQMTHLNAGLKPAWGEARNVHWMNGNTRVQGWLTLPKDFAPGKTYPLVVNVHGGPAHACT